MERDVQHERLRMVEADIVRYREDGRSHQARYIGERLQELNEVESRISGFQQEHVKASQRATLQHITAPVTGVVQELAIHTVGGVVTPAQG